MCELTDSLQRRIPRILSSINTTSRLAGSSHETKKRTWTWKLTALRDTFQGLSSQSIQNHALQAVHTKRKSERERRIPMILLKINITPRLMGCSHYMKNRTWETHSKDSPLNQNNTTSYGLLTLSEKANVRDAFQGFSSQSIQWNFLRTAHAMRKSERESYDDTILSS